MALYQSQSLSKFYYLIMLKSFLIWTFTLGVCLLVIGFPLVILMVIIGALLAVVLHPVMPVSAVLLVSSSIIGINILGILVGAAALTLNGIHPQEVSWLRWLHGQENPSHSSVYASCPLTCSVRH
jgi:hypothetical protein